MFLISGLKKNIKKIKKVVDIQHKKSLINSTKFNLNSKKKN
jgi:hypothetical protein